MFSNGHYVFLFFALFVNVNVTGHEFTEEQLQFVANLKLKDLPSELQLRIRKTNRMGDSR